VRPRKRGDAVDGGLPVGANPEPLTPANVVALQRLVGNRRIARFLRRRDLPAPGPTATATVQRKVEVWENRETNKVFDVKVGEGPPTIEANERHGKQYGLADYGYETKDGSMHLRKIQAFPEEGSGLGSLTMVYLARDALESKAKWIYIDLPAPSAIGFYEEKMGAEPVDPAGTPALTAAIRGSRAETDWRDRVVTEAAKRRHERDHYAEENYRSWGQLSDGEQRRLVEAERAEMERKGTLEAKVAEFVRGLAIARTRMRADPQRMLECASESAAKKWTTPR
jgi:hypothetical protein